MQAASAGGFDKRPGKAVTQWPDIGRTIRLKGGDGNGPGRVRGDESDPGVCVPRPDLERQLSNVTEL